MSQLVSANSVLVKMLVLTLNKYISYLETLSSISFTNASLEN